MTTPSNGITQEVIRDLMPPYRLDQDLLAATFACIAPPPPDATPAWRHARITRLLQEIAAQKPADAAQARIATQILTTRELADTVTAGALAPGLSLAELCRAARTTAELLRSANALERTLNRHQQNPVPFYGTVIQDEVDIPALDATWARTPTPPPAPNPNPQPTQADVPRRRATPPAPPPTPPVPTPPPAPTPRLPEPAAHPAPEAPPHTRPAAPNSDWTITRLDSGPGWTREVLRHRDAPQTQAAE
jgi:hypothetical protein